MLCGHCWNSIAVLKRPHPQPFFHNRGKVKTTNIEIFNFKATIYNYAISTIVGIA